MIGTADEDYKFTAIFMSDKFKFTSQEQKTRTCFVRIVKVHSLVHCAASNCFSQSLTLPNKNKQSMMSKCFNLLAILISMLPVS